MSPAMDLLDFLTEASTDQSLEACEGPHTHGLPRPCDRNQFERAGREIRVYQCRCGRSFEGELWDLHLASNPDPRPEPTTVNGTSNALGEHSRQLRGELAQRMSACLTCGHAKILHGRVNGRIALDHAGPNGDCSHCSCRTFRRHPDLGKVANTRVIAARDRHEWATT